jgi:hypothetical protein
LILKRAMLSLCHCLLSYYRQDIADPTFVLNDDSTLSVPAGLELGVRVIPERLAAAQLRHLALPG